MQLSPTIEVTDQIVDVSGLTKAQLNYYVSLARDLAAKYEKKEQGRQIFTLNGPAGAGKSVVATILELIFKEEDSRFQFMNVGLDGFHLSNEVLKEKGLMDVKGRHDTYDNDLLFEKLSEFKKGESIVFPVYSRQDHNPVADRLPTSNQNILLLIEGQWLLRNKPEWTRVSDLSTHNYEISATTEQMKEGVIDRHVRGGKTEAEATKFYTDSDLKNTEEIQKNSIKADEQVKFYKDI